MNKQHSYRYEKVVIGASLESLSFAFMNNLPVIFTELQKPFQFDFFDPSLDLSIFNFKNISTQMSSGEETIEVGSKKVSLYEHLLFVLSLAGQVPFSDKAKILEFDQEDCSLTVVTNGGLTIKVCADEFLVFDENDLSGIEPPSKEVEQRFKVLDWINVRSGTKHNFDFLKTRESFVNELFFFPSLRIDGNHDKKDVVSVSYLSADQVGDLDYSDSYVRLKVLSLMKGAGIKGRRNGRDVNNPERIIHRAIKIETAEREIVPLLRDEYENYKNLKFMNLDFREVLKLETNKENYVYKINNLLFV